MGRKTTTMVDLWLMPENGKLDRNVNPPSVRASTCMYIDSWKEHTRMYEYICRGRAGRWPPRRWAAGSPMNHDSRTRAGGMLPSRMLLCGNDATTRCTRRRPSMVSATLPACRARGMSNRDSARRSLSSSAALAPTHHCHCPVLALLLYTPEAAAPTHAQLTSTS